MPAPQERRHLPKILGLMYRQNVPCWSDHGPGRRAVASGDLEFWRGIAITVTLSALVWGALLLAFFLQSP